MTDTSGGAVASINVIERLQASCERVGSQKAWADKNGVSPAYVSDVLLGRREPGPSILEPLGLKAETTYHEVNMAPRELAPHPLTTAARIQRELDHLNGIVATLSRQLAEAQAELLMWRASFPGSAEAVKRDALSPPHAAAMRVGEYQADYELPSQGRRMTELADKLMQCYDSRELPSWYEIYDASTRLATLSRQLAEAQEALRPFADAVFNDNGDMTVSPVSDSEAYIKAYFVRRKAHAAAMGTASGCPKCPDYFGHCPYCGSERPRPPQTTGRCPRSCR